MGSHGTQVPVVRGFCCSEFFLVRILALYPKKTFELRGILSRRTQPPQGLSRHGGIHGLENGWKSPFPSIKKNSCLGYQVEFFGCENFCLKYLEPDSLP